jgi:hypothetical protein
MLSFAELKSFRPFNNLRPSYINMTKCSTVPDKTSLPSHLPYFNYEALTSFNYYFVLLLNFSLL